MKKLAVGIVGMMVLCGHLCAANIARIAVYRGKVKVVKPDGEESFVNMKNTPVAHGDRIVTGPAGKARLVFDDGTWVDLKKNTMVAVSEVTLKKSEMGKSIARVVDFKGGAIDSEIKKNAKTITKFATPSGVAAVKGTRMVFIAHFPVPVIRMALPRIVYPPHLSPVFAIPTPVMTPPTLALPVVASIGCTEGSAAVTTNLGTSMALNKGSQVKVKSGTAKAGDVSEGGSETIAVEKGTVVAKTAGGATEVSLKQGAAVQQTVNKSGASVIKAAAGTVEVKTADGKTVSVDKNSGPAVVSKTGTAVTGAAAEAETKAATTTEAATEATTAATSGPPPTTESTDTTETSETAETAETTESSETADDAATALADAVSDSTTSTEDAALVDDTVSNTNTGDVGGMSDASGESSDDTDDGGSTY